MPIMARPGKATSPGERRSENSQATSWQTACRRTSIRPCPPPVVSEVSSEPGGGSAPRSRSAGRRTGSEGFDILEGGGAVRLQGQEVVAAPAQDGPGDGSLGADGVDGDQGSLE